MMTIVIPSKSALRQELRCESSSVQIVHFEMPRCNLVVIVTQL